MPHTSSRWLGVLTLSLLASGCDMFGKIDPKKVEDSISAEFKKKGLALEKLKCPKDVKMKSGNDFQCTAQDEDGEELTINVEQTDDLGNIKWRFQGAIIDAEKLGDSLEEKIGSGADVECPNKTLVLPKGKKLICKLTKGGEKAKIEIKAINDKGDVKWEVKTGK